MVELAWISVLLLWTQQSAAAEEDDVTVLDSSIAAAPSAMDRAASGEMRVLLVSAGLIS